MLNERGIRSETDRYAAKSKETNVISTVTYSLEKSFFYFQNIVTYEINIFLPP